MIQWAFAFTAAIAFVCNAPGVFRTKRGYFCQYGVDGKPVWYLPYNVAGLDANAAVRDLKLSHRGTITFMAGQPDGEKIYEINYDGKVLWKGPDNGAVSGEPAEYYHHQFTRLSNGHYMVLGNEFIQTCIDTGYAQDTNVMIKTGLHIPGLDHLYVKIPLLTVIEYDESGNVVWNWKSSDYFMHSDVRYRKRGTRGTFDDVHGNAFFFDQKNGFVYVGFRDISRVVKIRYPDGKVVGEYGKAYQQGGPATPEGKLEQGNGMYCLQHSFALSESNNLYVYNNNSCDAGQGPSVVKLRLPDNEGEPLKKVWEYTCDVEPPYQNNDFSFISGGDVAELPGKCLFVNMGGTYGKMSIVSEDKKVLWSALPEQKISKDANWTPVPEYRAAILFRNDLERLIFGQAPANADPDAIMITYNSNK